MLAPEANAELRSLGRNAYFFSALAFSVEAYGVTLKSSAGMPVEFPTGFEIAGALALILCGITISLAVGVLRTFFLSLDAHVLQRISDSKAMVELRDQILQAVPNRTAAERPKGSWFLSNNPQIINLSSWIAFFLDAILPLILSTATVIYCFSAIISILSFGVGDRKETEYCVMAAAFLSGYHQERIENMSNNSASFSKASDERLDRHTNPDGSVGGYVSSKATVPASVTVPFSSMVCAGAVLSENQVVSENAFIDADGRERPSVVTRIGEVTFEPL